MIRLLDYLLLDEFNPNPLCTDSTERSKTHIAHQSVHIFMLALMQSHWTVLFTNQNITHTTCWAIAHGPWVSTYCWICVNEGAGCQTKKIQYLDFYLCQEGSSWLGFATTGESEFIFTGNFSGIWRSLQQAFKQNEDKREKYLPVVFRPMSIIFKFVVIIIDW